MTSISRDAERVIEDIERAANKRRQDGLHDLAKQIRTLGHIPNWAFGDGEGNDLPDDMAPTHHVDGRPVIYRKLRS